MAIILFAHKSYIRASKQQQLALARLAQSVERETLNLKVVGSTPTSGSIPGGEMRFLFFLHFCVCVVPAT